MVRAACAHVSADTVGRVLASLLAMLLLLSLDGLLPGSVRAGTPDSVTAIRQRQLRAERSMRRADHQISRLLRQRDVHSRASQQVVRRLERTIARRDAARERSQRMRERLATERAVRDRKMRVHPDPNGRQLADRPMLRRRVYELRARDEQTHDRAARLTHRVHKARQARQARSGGISRARVEARQRARERSESVLGSQISQMLDLSKERAAARVSAHAPDGFRRPAKGRVSQDYGCQQTRRARKAASHCLRFHDGIDIATAPSAPVRASADGYVAFVGWNPWDRGRRSYVVIVGHARGIETVYAHLRPIRKVKAGQFVRRGQLIGVVGLTGHTSGWHVHWEVSRDFRSMDPRRAGR
jgi:murein DD-endopeptidase MepM/ murein hydrolase activator NlpD